jgi:catalase-peroxidase
MLTSDIALKTDPAYAAISKRFHDDPQAFAEAFAKAWYKLTHRDMGPRARYLGPLVPAEPQLWQDPVPEVDHPLIGEQTIAGLKAQILASGLSIAELVSTAWASAATFRASRRRRTGRSISPLSWPGCSASSRVSRAPSTPRSPTAGRSRSPT